MRADDAEIRKGACRAGVGREGEGAVGYFWGAVSPLCVEGPRGRIGATDVEWAGLTQFELLAPETNGQQTDSTKNQPPKFFLFHLAYRQLSPFEGKVRRNVNSALITNYKIN